jgi:hypothetical protein
MVDMRFSFALKHSCRAAIDDDRHVVEGMRRRILIGTR